MALCLVNIGPSWGGGWGRLNGALFGSAKGVWVWQFQQSESPFFGPKNVRNGLLMSLFGVLTNPGNLSNIFRFCAACCQTCLWKTGGNLSTTNPIFDFECQFLQNPFQAIRAAPGSKPTLSNPSPASNPSRSRFRKPTFIRHISGGGILWYQGWDTFFVCFSMLFCECLSALQQSWTSLNRITDRNDQQLRPTAHTISSPHFSKKTKLFFGVRSPCDRDRTFSRHPMH